MDRNHILILVSLGVGAAGFIAGLVAHYRLSRMRRSLTVLQRGDDGQTMIEAVTSYIKEAQKIQGDLQALARRQDQLFARLGRSARNLGLVRYDAFDDMGGRMSFSAALLDDHGTGLVVTSINGRTEARTYAKTVEGGESEHNLSEEERNAIADAMKGKTKAKARARSE